ncbi:MAG: BMP family ABC transporter substrate-binding protein [Anaerolineae bacterium]|nr:BMP family ABC transporter substrate-binding protein [Thermoflexales bacterium]MDW8406371.1 BMP family ABC transporter substrate-binding protein [Anaerolineae bacterium]
MKPIPYKSMLVCGAISLLVAACAAPAAAPKAAQPTQPAPAPAEKTGLQIPDVQPGKFNVAGVLIGPHDDGGWSQAHYEGLVYVGQAVPNTHVAYVENVPEGAEAEQVIRALARKGFDLIFTTSFGYMDATGAVAEEFPNQTFIHVSGYKTNNKNFGNLFGAMENMKYLAGMIAGSRAKLDGQTKLGYIATFPIPEELRLGNAFALGMRKTCPNCTLDVRWINTWHDPVVEKAASESLFDAGAYIVFTGADTPAPADVAQARGDKWGITYDWVGSCKVERCLTAPYWDWGKIYAKIAQGVIDKTYKPGFDYFDADSGALGIYGLMEGQELTPGMKDLPAEELQMVKDILAKMLKGEFTRFDVFAGPIKDNAGNIVVPAGEKMTQADLDQFPPGAEGLACKYCMYWWAEGVTAELPKK